jgi:hypothetical protein
VKTIYISLGLGLELGSSATPNRFSFCDRVILLSKKKKRKKFFKYNFWSCGAYDQDESQLLRGKGGSM